MTARHYMLRTLLALLLVSCTRAQDDFELAPIASAAPESASFALIDDQSCDASVVTTVYELYAKNTMVFQTCVSDGRYKIFPFSGKHPTPQQIGDMVRSLACRAIFTGIVLSEIPECEVSNFPLRAASETLLKIGVDIDKHPDSKDAVPSTDRFLEMMRWRRDVNLAQAAGLPCDSESKLYTEYTSNLYTSTTNGLARLTADKEVQYRSTLDGSFSQEQIMSLPDVPGLRGSGSGDDVMAVYVADVTVTPLTASASASAHQVINHAESNEKQSTEAPESEKTATETSAAVRTSWNPSLVTALAAIVATVAFA